jgi:hypothetical protein
MDGKRRDDVGGDERTDVYRCGVNIGEGRIE